MDPLRIAIRAAFAFFFLLAMLRLAHKQSISETTTFDFVLSLIIGDLIDAFMFADVNATQFVAATGTLVIADLLVKFVTFHSDSLQFLVDGRPTIIFKDGKPSEPGLSSEGLSKADLLALLRLKCFDEEKHHEIRLGILEDSGEPSVLRKAQYKIAQKRDKGNLRLE